MAEVGAADSVLPLVQDSEIDIVIGDPHQLSAEVIARVLDAGTRVLVVSFTVDERHLHHAIDSGCSGYVDQRELGPADWPRLVRLAAKGNRVFSDAAFELFRRSRRRSAAVKNGHDLTLPSTRALSRRERQVLDHLVCGRTNKQIAQRLGVTDHTVKTQVTRIYEKLEVRNRARPAHSRDRARLGRRVALPQARSRVAPTAVQSVSVPAHMVLCSVLNT